MGERQGGFDMDGDFDMDRGFGPGQAMNAPGA